MQQNRPKHLNLIKIAFPLPAIVSGLHRISGLLLFLSLPALLWLLQATLTSPEKFVQYHACITHPLVKLFFMPVLWAYMHHFCAGIRFLFLDVHKGLDLPTARLTAKVVMIVSLILTALIGVLVW